jgi:gluconolactonase
MNRKVLTGVVLVILAVVSCGAEKPSVVKEGAKVEKLAGGFRFTEGPAVDAEGNLFFTDVQGNRIHKWSVYGMLSTFRENTGAANGLFFDKDGNLLACEGNNRRVISISPDGKVTVLADNYEGKKLNRPNDIWVDPKGGFYFSDPYFGARSYMEQEGEYVYYMPPGGKKLIRVIDDMVRPNGVIGTPDGRLLYVADYVADKTFVYKINEDGTLSDKILFAPEGIDGMTIDNEGNIYITTKTNAVSVYNKKGEKIETIEVPEQPANLCFGGRDNKTLFITARTSLYSVQMRVSGVDRPGVVAEGAKVEKLAGGFRFTEGPAADKEGNIFFTDIPNNRIHKWTLDGKLITFDQDSGGANGLFFDKKGNLLVCEGVRRRVASIGRNRRKKILADKYNNKMLNSPNDLWADLNGGVYFTDPRYGDRGGMEQGGECVYYLSPDHKKLIRVIDDLIKPNGVIGTANGKTLYVADHEGGKTFEYSINKDGTLSNKKLFAPEGSDGMTIDNEGNVYLTTDAVVVYNKDGERIETIEVPEQPSNVCFGGKDKRTLFITARTSLYSVQMRVASGE